MATKKAPLSKLIGYQFLPVPAQIKALLKPGMLGGEVSWRVLFALHMATLGQPTSDESPRPVVFEGGAKELFLMLNEIKSPKEIEKIPEHLRTSQRAIDLVLSDFIARGILAKVKEGAKATLRLLVENWPKVQPPPAEERAKPPIVAEPIPEAAAVAKEIPESRFVVMPGRASQPILLKTAITIHSVRYCNEGKHGDLTQLMRLNGTELVIVGRVAEAEARRTESESQRKGPPVSEKNTSRNKTPFVTNKQVSSSPPPQNAPSPPARRTLDVEAFQSDAERYRQATDSERAEWKKRYPANFAHAKKQAQGKTHGAGGDA
jgi:hypothetical protein